MGMARELPHSFAEALKVAKRILSSNTRLVSEGVIDTESEIVVLAAFRQTTGKKLSRLDLFSRMNDAFPAKAGERVVVLAHGRSEDRPLQHLTGFQQFLSNEYKVSSSTLVPRPETEALVAHAVRTLRKGSSNPHFGIEVGLGTGVIAIELLKEFPALEMAGSELVSEARFLASENARSILGDRFDTRLKILEAGDSLRVLEPFEALPLADFLISNPPYVSLEDEIAPDVLRHEPASALFAPKSDVVYFYRKIAEGAASNIRVGGAIFLEVPAERADVVLELFAAPQWECSLFTDLAGKKRILSGILLRSK
jgi:release factor glutamine methyltransferase